mmetsp:Transcript_26175/g.53612  ORF Transcript_26175/g.53612 Transcript_26175/m.53612 type:complete len:137 (-) Transcript_26175:1-411(-)
MITAFTTDRITLIVSEVLLVLFFTSAWLQLNDEDVIIWGGFYVAHAALAGCVLVRRKLPGGGRALVQSALAMAVLSVLMIAVSTFKLYTAHGEGDRKSRKEAASEELMGSVLGLFAAGYFAALTGKGMGKRLAEES